MFGPGREARAIETASGTCLQGVERGLSIGKKLPVLPNMQAVPDLASVPAVESHFDGVLWRLDTELKPGIPAVRQVLAPGARLFLLVELVPSVWGVTRQLLGGREIPRFTREGICEDMLLLGLVSPRVWVDAGRWLAVSAHLPSAPDALDQVFSQPAAG